MPRDGAYRSVGEGKDSVQVHLRADQEALAADLVAHYGDLVSITVGAYPYPLPSPGSITTPDLCTWSVPMGTEVVGGLRATPRASGSVRSGHDGRGTVTVTNTSGVTVSFSAGTPYAAVLLKSGTDAVVGVYDSEIAGVGSGATLRSGEHLTVDMLIGTASCNAAMGHAVAPGTYDVIVVLNDIQIGSTAALQRLRSAAGIRHDHFVTAHTAIRGALQATVECRHRLQPHRSVSRPSARGAVYRA